MTLFACPFLNYAERQKVRKHAPPPLGKRTIAASPAHRPLDAFCKLLSGIPGRKPRDSFHFHAN